MLFRIILNPFFFLKLVCFPQHQLFILISIKKKREKQALYDRTEGVIWYSYHSIIPTWPHTRYIS